MPSIDFETKSKADIKVCGAIKYSCHDSTDALCLAYEDKLWKPGDPAPESLFESIRNNCRLYAFNAGFEAAIWRNVMVKRYGWPEVKPHQWYCTASACYALGLPRSLENAAAFMGLEIQKDAKGKRTMLKLSVPDKKTGEFYIGTPEEYQRLYAYCLQDVQVEKALLSRIRYLSEEERKVWLFDQIVNRRGIPVDVDLARSAMQLWREHIATLDEEIRDLTGGEVTSVTKTKAIVDWCKANGFAIHSLAKDYLEQVFSVPQDIPDNVKRVIEVRREGASAAVAKFEAILKGTEGDGRMRGCFTYHGAATGRWTGSRFQPQNLARGCINDEKMLDVAIDLAKERDLDTFKMFWPNVGEALGTLVRPTIMAPPGKRFIVVDFAAVEARGVAWGAGQESMLQAFRNKECGYRQMGSHLYKKPANEISKDERQFGKTCLEADTPVVTNNGVKRIVDVSLDDLLWDGIEWVKHEGVICQGAKPVIRRYGLGMTTDHEILVGDSWWDWSEVVGEPNLFRSALKSASLPCCDTLTKTNHGVPMFAVHADGREAFSKRTNTIGITGVGALRFAKNGERTGEHFSPMFKRYRDGMFPSLKWTESITTKDMSRGTSDLYQDATTYSTEEALQSYKTEYKNSRPVFDIVNAGPRSRFTVISLLGPMTVSNCVLGCGYGLGASKFKDQCTKYGLDVTDAFAKKAVDTYRKSYPLIPAFWREMENAAVQCVKRGKPIKVRHCCEFRVEDDWLFMRLPSGRDLAYYKPQLKEGKYGPQLAYQGVALNGKAWTETTYGGKLVENWCQAVCRDLLVHAMFECEKVGYRVVMHVHDEAVYEVPSGFGSVEEVCELMKRGPEWASTFPIGAEGFETVRYRK